MKWAWCGPLHPSSWSTAHGDETWWKSMRSGRVITRRLHTFDHLNVYHPSCVNTFRTYKTNHPYITLYYMNGNPKATCFGCKRQPLSGFTFLTYKKINKYCSSCTYNIRCMNFRFIFLISEAWWWLSRSAETCIFWDYQSYNKVVCMDGVSYCHVPLTITTRVHKIVAHFLETWAKMKHAPAFL